MARYFNHLDTEHLLYSGAVLSAEPITFACWFNTEGTTDQTLMELADASTQTGHELRLRNPGATDLIAYSYEPGTGGVADTTAYSTNTWHHACGVFAANNSRSVYLDGGSKDTDTTAVTVVNLDKTTIGLDIANGGTNWPMDGSICHAAIWNIALTDAEVLSLAKGFSPLLIHPQNLVAYWPFLRSDNDIVGGYHLTPVNVPTWSSLHAPIIMPAAVVYSFMAAGAPPAVTVPIFWHHLNKNIGR